MKILDTISDSGADIYYNSKFRVVLEDHMTFLRSHPDNDLLNIEPAQAYKYAGDLFGILQYYNLSPYLHWIVMRVNGMTSPTEFRDTTTALIIPSMSVIATIRNTHMSQSKMKK